MNKWLAIVAMTLSFNVAAESVVDTPCDFAQETGLNFTFTPLEPDTLFKMRENGAVYPHWVNNRFQPVKIQERDFAYRQAKLEKDYFYRRLEGINITGKKPYYVRYYKAVTQNCQTVWARIDESSPKFKKYFDESNHLMTGDIPWDIVSNLLHMQISDSFLKLHAWKGKKITILPFTDKSKVIGKTKDQQQTVELKAFEEVILTKVHPNGFVLNGKMTSSIQIEIKRDNGQELLIPWQPKRMMMDSPWKNKNIRTSYLEDIKNGFIRFGMNADEIKLAWGSPDYVRWLSKYPKEHEKSQWIKDDEFPYGATYSKYRLQEQDSRERAGYYQVWHYSERLPEGHVLVIDDKNILHKLNQAIGITPNSPHKPVALPYK